jgi:hypothetical protein
MRYHVKSKHKIKVAKNLNCPVCHQSINGASSAQYQLPIKPRPEDISLCAWCGALLVYKLDGKRLFCAVAPESDIEKLDPEQQQIVRSARALFIRLAEERATLPDDSLMIVDIHPKAQDEASN